MKFRSTLLAASILALPFAAAHAAEPLSGLYVGAGVGANFMQDEKVILNTGARSELKTDPGFAGLVSVGYGFGNGFRAELEGDYRYNSFSDNAGGHEQKYGGFLNALYDFNNISPWMVPYVGVGIGYQAVEWQNVHGAGANAGLTANNSTLGSLAYQGIAGVSFPVTQQLSLTGEYHFMGLATNRNFDGNIARAGGSSVPVGIRAKDDLNHTVLVGLRYSFGAPAAPVMGIAAAAPAPAPARSYLVFFDWDKSNLTDRARQIIRDAAENSRKVEYTKLEVNGYTDTSGTPKYNQGLSVRRAQAVAAELVKDGVPRNAISITGYGDTKLLVPTGPGVREPQNRRVEIIIR